MSTLNSTQAKAGSVSELSAEAARVQAQSEELRRAKRRRFIIKSILAHLVVLLFVIFAAFPIYFLITAALRPGQTLYSTNLQLIPSTISFDNFDYMINHTPLLKWLLNSIIVASATTVLSVCLATTAAYAFSRWNFPGRNGIMSLLLALQAFPAILGLLAIFVIFKEFHMLDTLWGLVLAYSAGGLIFAIWNTKGYFDTIPIELEESARVDGATPTQTFIQVILPLA